MPIKVGVANTNWVIYMLVSNILAHLKSNFNNLQVFSLPNFSHVTKFEFYLNRPHIQSQTARNRRQRAEYILVTSMPSFIMVTIFFFWSKDGGKLTSQQDEVGRLTRERLVTLY